MRRISRISALGGAIMLGFCLAATLVGRASAADTPPTGSGVVLDTFVLTQTMGFFGAPPTFDYDFVDGAGVLGTQRDVILAKTGGAFPQRVDLNAYLGELYYSAGTGVAGYATISWDGTDNDAAVLDPVGLAGVDLTNAGLATGFHVRVNDADHPFTINFDAYTDGANWSSGAGNVPIVNAAGGDPPYSLFVPFNAFTIQAGAGADFASIGAVVMTIDGQAPASIGLDTVLDFVETAAFDFGDLPAPYANTLAAEDGARHVVTGLVLGSAIDAEDDGQPQPTVDGDDVTTTDDEEGLAPIGPWVDGPGGGAVNVTVTGGPGCLSGWIDWDGNNAFDNVNEAIIVAEPVVTGDQPISFDVPPGTFGTGGAFNARFRLTPDTNTIGNCAEEPFVDFRGVALGGEVEDYQWSFTPTAVSLSQASTQPLPTRYDALHWALAVLIALSAIAWRASQRLVAQHSANVR